MPHVTHLPTPVDEVQLFDDDGQGLKAESQTCNCVRGSTSTDSTSKEALLADADTTFEQTVEGRVEYLIRCARKVGFQDLDSAVTTLYTAKFDEDSECSIAQHYSRKRCLPNLLEELRSKSVSWKKREVQPYQDEVLKSAESLLISEMRPERPAGVDDLLSNLLSGCRGSGWSASCHQLQDEVSVNMTECLTSADRE